MSWRSRWKRGARIRDLAAEVEIGSAKRVPLEADEAEGERLLGRGGKLLWCPRADEPAISVAADAITAAPSCSASSTALSALLRITPVRQYESRFITST